MVYPVVALVSVTCQVGVCVNRLLFWPVAGFESILPRCVGLPPFPRHDGTKNPGQFFYRGYLFVLVFGFESILPSGVGHSAF